MNNETTAHEDDKATAAKKSNSWKGMSNIDRNILRKPTLFTRQFSKNALCATVSTVRRGLHTMPPGTKRVWFGTKMRVATFVESKATTTFATYYSGAVGNYASEADSAKEGRPILRHSSRKVNTTNSWCSQGKYVEELSIRELSDKAAEVGTFDSFPQSLISVGKTNDNGHVSIFTKTGFTVHKEEDVLIACKGVPLMIRKQDETRERERERERPHPIDAAERIVAATSADKESKKETEQSQQSVRPSLHRASNQVNARGLQVPGQINIAESSEGWQIC